MKTKEETRQMRKNNMKIFPAYKMLGFDYLFFYTIDFLFLTQIKGISAANVVLKSTFYSIFTIVLQIPANLIVEFLGRKNSLVLGNILNCFYMIVIMLSRNLGDLIFAEFISAIAFSIKNVAEPGLLNESIPPSRYKSQIFSKINSKGTSGYFLLNGISKIIAGCLFSINGYLPIIFSLSMLIIVSIVSMNFIEPLKNKKKNINEVLAKKEIKNMKEGFSYILKSERLKALILCTGLIGTLISILINYHVSLLEDLKVSSVIIGIIAAGGSLISAYSSKKQDKIHKLFRNKTLTIMSTILSVSCFVAGICRVKSRRI